MLHEVGLNSASELFDSIPQELRLTRNLDTTPALSELEPLAGFDRLAATNYGAQRISFLGAGAYQHYIPTVRSHHFPVRVFHCVHTLPAGNFAGHTAGYF